MTHPAATYPPAPVTSQTHTEEVVSSEKPANQEQLRIKAVANQVEQSNRAFEERLDVLENQGLEWIISQTSDKNISQTSDKKTRVAARVTQLLKQNPNPTTKLTNQLQDRASKEIAEEMLQEYLAREASLPRAQSELSLSSSISPKSATSDTVDDSKPSAPNSDFLFPDLNPLKGPRHQKPRTLSKISTDERPSLSRNASDNSTASSPPPAWLVASQSSDSTPDPLSNSNHLLTLSTPSVSGSPPFSNPGSPFNAAPALPDLHADPIEAPYGIKEFTAEQILDIRFTQRTVLGATRYRGEEHTIEDLKNALINDFKNGTHTIPPIKIVPILTFYRNKEPGEKFSKDLIEFDGKLYMKTGVYTSLDNRRLLALKMAIAEMPARDREEFTSCVKVLDPMQPADITYLYFNSDPNNPFNSDPNDSEAFTSNICMVRDRVNMKSNTNSGVHTAACYFDRKGRPVDPYWGFPNLPKILP